MSGLKVGRGRGAYRSELVGVGRFGWGLVGSDGRLKPNQTHVTRLAKSWKCWHACPVLRGRYQT
ncbi:hypothetical protein CBR55_34275, partial [Bacillus thuringiensis]